MRLKKSKLMSALLSPLYLWIDKRINSIIKKPKKNKKILLIFLGYIGDYILFRNFIEEIKKHPDYKSYSITLCGDPLWKSISENLDKKYADSFIWINRKDFVRNLSYRKKVLEEIHNSSFEIVINPNYGRDFSTESLVHIANSLEKVGSEGSSEGIYSWQKNISNKYYTKRLPLSAGIEFEFLKNKDFFEKFLHKKIHTKFCLPFNKKKTRQPYAVFVPGAGAEFKKWSPKNFAKVADFLIKNKKLKIMISGSKTDSKLAQEIISHSKFPSQILDQTGNTLLQSIDLIGNSKFLLVNETGPSHIGAAVGIKTVCLSNGDKYGKFHPYPEEVSKKILHVYPSEIEELSEEERLKKFSTFSGLDVNSISPSVVLKKIKSFIS